MLTMFYKNANFTFAAWNNTLCKVELNKGNTTYQTLKTIPLINSSVRKHFVFTFQYYVIIFFFHQTETSIQPSIIKINVSEFSDEVKELLHWTS